MLLEANLTESHKTDVRDNETKFFDEIKEKQVRDDKEPRSQFYGLIFNQEIQKNNTFTLGLIQDSKGFLTFDTGNVNYTLPNYIPLWFSTPSFSVTDLGFQSVEKIRLNILSNWFRRSNAVSFGSDFNFDMYCLIAEVSTLNPELVGFNDYTPFLQIKLGNVKYTALNNTFSNLYQKFNYDLSDVISNQSFTGGAEVTKLSIRQYDKLKSGNTRLSVYFGFQTATLTVAQLQFMENRPFQNQSSVQLQYKGISKL
jgi:hypothetical protein